MRAAASHVLADGEVSTAQLCDEVGITFRQADHWARKGYLLSRQPGEGSGFYRRYDESEVEVARVLSAMSEIARTNGGEMLGRTAAAMRRGENQITYGPLTISWATNQKKG